MSRRRRKRCHRKCLKLYNCIIWKWDDALAIDWGVIFVEKSRLGGYNIIRDVLRKAVKIMSLYGHTYISIDSLKRWVNSLSIDRIQSVDIGGDNLEIKDETKELLELQLKGFSECINQNERRRRLEEIPRDSKSCIL